MAITNDENERTEVDGGSGIFGYYIENTTIANRSRFDPLIIGLIW
ncbi:hypothetical protein PM10SUCC1_29140 [Propionigenium maris DSM 9537]|uniref:Uncharacterized protein n=1 Tax=Propionigenium maris DSM 9537 TaxID=1123000 RepID=A0A9W6GNK4_9FUSO|nr:hypothetical protein PM10SUCC1_29140 [Propionigenium maris DSM 9537]